MQIEWWDVDRPKDYPHNPRKWSAQAIEKVGVSIRAYGFRQPVVVDKDEVIVIGHLRRAAARQIGLKQVPVHVARDLSPAQIRGLRLADYSTNQEAEWNEDLLGIEISELASLDFDLSLTGFDLTEIDRFMASESAGLTDEDAAPEPPAVPVTRTGDLWLMGGHVVCPDCGEAHEL